MTIHTPFLSLARSSIRTYGLEAKVRATWIRFLPDAQILCSRSAILRGTKPINALTRAFFHCCDLYNRFPFEYRQWPTLADRVVALLTWTSDLHCFGALGVGPAARTRPHVRGWRIGNGNSYCITSEQFQLKRLGHRFSSNVENREKQWRTTAIF